MNVTLVTDDVNGGVSNDYSVYVWWNNPNSGDSGFGLGQPVCNSGTCTFQINYVIPDSSDWINGGTYPFYRIYLSSGYLGKSSDYRSNGMILGNNRSGGNPDTHSFTVPDLQVTGP